MKTNEIRVGAKCHFVPYISLARDAVNPDPHGSQAVVGTIVYVNEKHRYFRAEYPVGSRGKTLTECFKF